MIKDKITKDLKIAISDSIKKTKDLNIEHGFFICQNKDGKLIPSETRCIGDKCGIRPSISPRPCQGEIQGFFHVHPQKDLLLDLEKKIGRNATEEDIKHLKFTDIKGVESRVQMPSHVDILMTLIKKCDKFWHGTACIAGDIEPDKVECWTVKKNAANFMNCLHARIDRSFDKNYNGSPKKWIRPLFDTEIIDLEE